jgi:phospho-N-acetylmuramoyl-pentapeptide-transferase
MDDYIKVVKKRNLGLTARQKTFLQLLVSAGYLVTMLLGGMKSTNIPFIGDVDITRGFGLIFWPIALMFIYGFTNAVNLTDGLDGLATCVTLVVSGFFAIVAFNMLFSPLVLMSAALIGGLLGFLIFNAHPAKVFMGDTGSLFLGGAVTGAAFMINQPLIIVIAGGIYVIEALSVILQVGSFKIRNKRIFKMAPIHHHFEKCGWNEVKVVSVFSAVTAVLCVISWFAI